MFKSYDEAVQDLIRTIEWSERSRLRDVWERLDKKS
jgi:hypothetical protein